MDHSPTKSFLAFLVACLLAHPVCTACSQDEDMSEAPLPSTSPPVLPHGLDFLDHFLGLLQVGVADNRYVAPHPGERQAMHPSQSTGTPRNQGYLTFNAHKPLL